MTPLRFEEARQCVIDLAGRYCSPPKVERVPLTAAAGRVLAQDILADRAYPAVHRSVRDGFAVQAAGFNGAAQIIGEVRAGQTFTGTVTAGQAVEIMTGAPMPNGSDAVIMIEHAMREGDRFTTDRHPTARDHVSARASHAFAGEPVLSSGERLDFRHISVLATVGIAEVPVYALPRVQVIATGDELVAVTDTPAEHQVRNSNTYSIAAQVARSGAIPCLSPTVRDDFAQTRAVIEAGLRSDLLLLSGGVSAGKYDLVEGVLRDLGAEIYFDRVKIQPGQPLVFGRAGTTFFFGLPGNPVSTAVTFEAIARTALDLIAGCRSSYLPLVYARLRQGYTQKPGLTRFLPAILESGTPEVTPLQFGGSGDVFALGRANCFLVARDDRESWEAGDLIEVLPR